MRAVKLAILVALFSFGASPRVSVSAEEGNHDPPNTAENARAIAEYYQYAKVRVLVVAKVGKEFFRFAGSGFFIDEAGSVLTASHIVIGTNGEFPTSKGAVKPDLLSYYIEFVPKNSQKEKAYERRYVAILRGADPYRDLAVLKVLGINSADYNVTKIGDSKNVQLNDTVYTFGDPNTIFKRSFGETRVSFVHRRLGAFYIEDFIEFDKPIIAGHSGGGLINTRGELVGIITAGSVPGSVGLAVPSRLFNIDRLHKGNVTLARHGFEFLPEPLVRFGAPHDPDENDLLEIARLTGLNLVFDRPRILAIYVLSFDHPLIVTDVQLTRLTIKPTVVSVNGKPKPVNFGSIIAAGDILVKVGDREVATGLEARLLILEHSAGETLTFEFLRATKGSPLRIVVSITLE